MSIEVKRVRVLCNVLLAAGLFLLVLWIGRAGLADHLEAVFWGVAAGAVYAIIHWHRLAKRITRTDRRFARNRVFVRFISMFEFVLVAAAWSHGLLIALLALLLIALLLDWIAGHWWSLLIGSFGLAGATLLALRLLIYEWRHGPVYYQYISAHWAGKEGMLYAAGRVVQPLDPAGTIMVRGELWNAVSATGETIEQDEPVEVVDCDGLQLTVDRL